MADATTSYNVLKPFRDKVTGKKYIVGSTYTGSDNKERVDMLIQRGYIAKTKSPDLDQDELKSLGGGMYELPNGEKVKGKKEALKALEALQVSGGNADADDDSES